MGTAIPLIRSVALTFSISQVTGGLFYSVRKLHQELLDFRVTTDVLTLEGGWGERLSKSEMEVWSPLPLKVFPCGRPRKLGYSPHLVPALRENSPQVMHCHGLWHFHLIAADRYRRLRNTPLIISSHGMLDPWAMQNREWRKRIASWLYQNSILRRATCLRALCEPEARAIRQQGFRNALCIIPNGVDLPKIGSKKSEDEAWANTIEQGQKVLLVLGRIAPKKGLVNLLRAWALKRKSDEWVLVIAGVDENGHEGELKELTSELGLQISVKFLGPQFGVSKDALFRRASAFILPSLSEGLPLAILEAWAYSKPVIMTPQCNLPEGVAVGAAIQILPEAKRIAEGLVQLFEMTREQLDEMGKKGQILVSERFTWPKVASQMRRVYEWVLGGGTPPNCVQLN